MEYTSQQRAAFKDAYARRFRKQLIMIALLFAVMAPLPFTEDDATCFGLSMSILGPIVLAVAFTGTAVFVSRNWRCPACDEPLGRAFNPTRCRSCGIDLRA